MVAEFVILVNPFIVEEFEYRKQDSLREILETSYHRNIVIVCIYVIIIATDNTIRNHNNLVNQREIVHILQSLNDRTQYTVLIVIDDEDDDGSKFY